jgi:A/G-specific adenine glycosylase
MGAGLSCGEHRTHTAKLALVVARGSSVGLLQATERDNFCFVTGRAPDLCRIRVSISKAAFPLRYHSSMFQALIENQFAPLLLRWSDEQGRTHLPWQKDPTPYRVWVSEVMLQQTQVATVIPYFERFMSEFPEVKDLSEAPLDEVLHLWTGLGYYARARNLHKSAQRVVQQLGGRMPQDFDALLALPGIGRSTAGAILALSLGQRHPILDGNVKRVLTRVFGIEGDPGTAGLLKILWQKATRVTPAQRVGAYTQAIMDLGATVCRRTRPACGECPMSSRCFAAHKGRQADFPGRRKKRQRPSRAAILLIAEMSGEGESAVLIQRRPASGVWGGLWSPPQFADELAALDWCRREFGEPQRVAQELAPIDHAFTHFDLRLTPLRVRILHGGQVKEPDDRMWYRLAMPARVGLPQPIRQLFARMRTA